MQDKTVLSLADAERILDAAQKEAESQGWKVAIAVVDDGGHALALRRLDGCAPMGAYVATEKARSAALGGKETQAFEDMINGGRAASVGARAQGHHDRRRAGRGRRRAGRRRRRLRRQAGAGAQTAKAGVAAISD